MPDRRLADFLVIGAVKAATTSVARHLGTHPDVYVPPRKELAYFTYEYNWLRGPDWYASCFADGRTCRAVGEASPQYAWWPSYEGVPERASRIVPDARIVYMVRHPIERMASMYRQAVVVGGERRSFTRAVLETSDYLDTSRYRTQIGRWLDHFPAEQVLVVETERLAAHARATMAAIFAFVGVDPSWVPPGLDVRHHARPIDGDGSPFALPAPVTELILDVLRPEVDGVRPLLAPDFDGWGLLA